ncbi:glycoside hydrolase N-terminal domain-containing protein [Streptomyces sp. 549]|uniref:glycosyl hydrolase family 95 catalytic domain-containing protein n=1 Tax=Streptomyces sp. 549 TaxID=3049076 RepID=UPI0024C3DD9C|nr:glycoside hydrolase N-terminal domain-containing protein [Streptomyces sp. 549]MDK1472414.1 glycoside hydrolase N-terminal domain-containing protein [Streptomyces sp. 549]
MSAGSWEPAPAARWEDAYLSGNGRHGAMVLGDPDDDRVIVNHHSLVRPNGSEHAGPPQLADRLPSLRDRLLAGDTDAADTFTDGRPLLWVQPFHPAFMTRFRHASGGGGEPGGTSPVGGAGAAPEGADARALGYRREVDYTSGVVTARTADRDSRVFVSRADDVIVQHLRTTGDMHADGRAAPPNRPSPGGLRGPHGLRRAPDAGGGISGLLSLDHRLPGAPDRLAVGHGTALVPEGALLSLRVRYPDADGLGFTGVTLALVRGGRTSISCTGAAIEHAEEVLLLTRVRRHRGDGDTPAASDALRALLPPDATPGTAFDHFLTRHVVLHATAFGRASLSLDAKADGRAAPGSELLAGSDEHALLERLHAAGRYHLLSASGMLPPRLTGLWTGDWDTAWSGAFTTNANLNLQIAAAPAADLPEVGAAHAALVFGQWDHWRDNARAVFGTRGVVAPSHTDGESGHTRHFQRAYPLHLWTAGADWLLKPLLDEAEATGVPHPRLAAALAEVATFYEDFLTRAGPDGQLVLVPSYSPENRPANASWVTRNATMDVTAARHALLTAAAHHPGPDADRWTALADRLPPYRVNTDGALAEWADPDLADNYDHRHLSHLYGVWPLDEITPYDTPDLAAAAHRALELRGAENDSAHGHLHHGLIAARLADAPRAEACLRALLVGDYFHDSLMSAHYPGRDVYNADAAHALPALLTEMLLQSTPHRLVLLPAAPASWPGGALLGVRTRFGARVDLTWGNRLRTDPEAPGPRAGQQAEESAGVPWRAVITPDRAGRVELRAPGTSTRPLTLVAGQELVVTSAGA